MRPPAVELSTARRLVPGFQASTRAGQATEPLPERAEFAERVQATATGSAFQDPAGADACEAVEQSADAPPAAWSCGGASIHRAGPTKYRSAALAETHVAELARCPVGVLATARRGRWVGGVVGAGGVVSVRAGRVVVAARDAVAEQAQELLTQKRKDCLQEFAAG